jgi:hypothetical protein
MLCFAELHNGAPALAIIPVVCILPHPIDGQLDGIISRMQIDINSPAIWFRQLPVGVKFVLEELVFIFCDPGIHIDGVYTAKLIDCCLEGSALGFPGCDVAYPEEEAVRGDQGAGLSSLRGCRAVEFDRECRRRAAARPIPQLPPVMRIVLFVRLVRLALLIVNVFVAAISSHICASYAISCQCQN